MKKIFKFEQFVEHLLLQAIAADTEFNLQRAYFRSEADLYDLSSDKLSLEEVTFSFHLQKHEFSWPKRIWLHVRGIDPDKVYEIGKPDATVIPIKATIKRASAYGQLTVQQDAGDTKDIYLRA